MASSNIPDIDIDLYAPESLLDPYPNYAILRDAAPVVRIPKYDVYVMARFEDVQAGLADWQHFSSASGVALSASANVVFSRSTLGSDDPLHAERRSIIAKPLSPARLNALRKRVFDEAEQLIDRLDERRSFDAATDLSRHLPATIVYDLIGLPKANVNDMLRWTKGGFNSLGPAANMLAQEGTRLSYEMGAYAAGCTRDAVKPGGWASYLFEQADAGVIDEEQARAFVFDYLGPSLDTTILATTTALKLFADHPDQWQALRERPSAIPNAINEVMRLESPVQAFSRLVTEDTRWGDQTIPGGSRILMLYGSGNRDERRWTDPERFDIGRANADQLGFGHGPHVCAGANLARLEISAILSAMLPRVEAIEVTDAELLLNNVLRGYEKLVVTLH